MKTKNNLRRVVLTSLVVLAAAVTADAQERTTRTTGGDGDRRVQQAKALMDQAVEDARYTAWDSAIGHYREVLAIFPDFHEARFGIGKCYEELNQTSKAVEEYRLIINAKGARPDPIRTAISRVKALSTPGLSPEDKKSHELATAFLLNAERLKQVAERDPTKRLAYRESLKQAISRLEKLREKADTYIPLFMELGLAYELDGRDELAARSFRDYLRRYATLNIPLGTQEEDIQNRQILLEAVGARNADDGPYFSGGKSDNPGTSPRMTAVHAKRGYDQAFDLETLGEYRQAIEVYRQVVSDYPAHHIARYHLGLCLHATGEGALAIEQWRIAACAKNTSAALREELCELVEKAAAPPLNSEQEKLLSEAVSCYEAAKSVVERSYILVGSHLFPRDSDYNTEIQFYNGRSRHIASLVKHLVVKAEVMFAELLRQSPENMRINLPFAKTAHLHFEVLVSPFNSEFNGPELKTAREKFRRYLDSYRGLDMPESQKFLDALARSRELDFPDQ